MACLPFGGVDDQLNLVVLDHINDMRPAFAHFVNGFTGETVARKAMRCLWWRPA
jgi:hypothetical protein